MTLGRVVEIVRPHRADGHGEAWAALADRRLQVRAWVTAGVAGVKICELLARDGVSVPERTVQRFIAAEFGPRRGQGATVRIADGEPGHELQIDFARSACSTIPSRPARRSRVGPAAGVSRVDLHGGVLPPHVRVVVVHADHRCRDRRV